MKRNGTKLIIPTIFMILSLFSSIGITFAWWFVDNMLVSNVTGKTPPSYFAFGDGSEEDPYGITSPVHLYNLAWLQYLGQFNNPEEQKQYHFVVDKDIDMTGLVLPPIGTTDNPFIGSFDGRDHLISNLTVSNTISADGITKYPSGISSLSGVDIVGMFGVVGNYKDVVNYEYDSSLIDISNLYLDKVTVKSAEENSLMGLLFGYINEGNSANIDIGQGNLEASKNVKPLSDYDSISKYSLIGDFNEANISWTDKPQDTNTPEDGAGWGESLDMYTLTRRINYMFVEGDIMNKNTSFLSSSNIFNTEIYNENQTNPLHYNKEDIQFYLAENTYIPLNIDKETMIDNATESSKTIPANKTSLSNSFYSQKQPEIVLPTNTGYIVGGGTPNFTSSWPSIKGATIKTHSVTHDWLNYAYGLKDDSTSIPSNKTNVDILTMVETDSKNGDYQLQIISDKYNQGKSNSYINKTRVPVENYNFNNYDDVREDLNTLLNNNYIYGLGFWKTNPYSYTHELSTDNSINENVSILGKNYTNYQLLNGSIMFNVSSGGYLTLIAAGIQSKGLVSHSNYSLYNLYKISRNPSTNQINQIIKIENIYKTVDGQYLYNQSSRPSNSSLIYSIDWIKKVSMFTSLLYLEIPLFSDMYPAEFALSGCVEPNSSTYGPYLMYLDIGASGDSGVITPPTPTPEYTIDSIQFIDTIPSDRSAHPALLYVTFKVSKDQTTTLVNVYFKRESNELMLYYVDPSNGLTIAASVVDGVTAQIDNAITF